MSEVSGDENADANEADDVIESAESEQSEPLDLSTSERKLVTQPYDLGVKGISSDIASGRIILAIEYQRNYVWDSAKASRLIESLLLNVPIPVCYFAENEDGGLEVIDGLQRLTTIRNFLNGDFALSGLSVLSELNGQQFGDLAPRDQRRLENRTIRCIVITEESNPDIKFDVFERLNTGAASLTAQELRNSVYRGAFNDSLKATAREEWFTQNLGNASNRRMEHEELVLRFFALLKGIGDYKPPLRQFLNTYMRSRQSVALTDTEVNTLREVSEAANSIFGDTPFRGFSGKNAVNKAVFDSIMIALSGTDLSEVAKRRDDVASAFAELADDEDFLTSIGRATADRQRMLYRMKAVVMKLRALGLEVDFPDGIADEGQS